MFRGIESPKLTCVDSCLESSCPDSWPNTLLLLAKHNLKQVSAAGKISLDPHTKFWLSSPRFLSYDQFGSNFCKLLVFLPTCLWRTVCILHTGISQYISRLQENEESQDAITESFESKPPNLGVRHIGSILTFQELYSINTLSMAKLCGIVLFFQYSMS